MMCVGSLLFMVTKELLLIQEVDIIENEQMEHDQQLEEQVADFEMW